ncbi:ABC transporter substrate-binding protein [Mixta calida]|uniref:Oligopeptide ABC transporter substrate-binding protein OppA n=3 Tax=Mixta calida TaxID=665913 RepID=A0ABM6S1U9_9GAMM|nr:ABC transporter substrate-binding protein [Mixta calida]AIX73625.1 peptide ABC transporter substrate-binding protein [Pantoea sp. PSNIH2]POU48682.1 oligopeptide ABC transporter substrate-binding protein OppA [Pantoea sp. PSNIH5]POU66402.1 oligopeptide ABC transporter substrate-binding protein OppA [Pantoea sp. PSNIH4]POY68453.1 oligopeptide ABC transporter substrate-binding protein OppA [Pantoea sp. PSNIH3]AUY25433.1 oligopeptide ABC transporter substrate-binding protein OppA [Mixta calida]
MTTVKLKRCGSLATAIVFASLCNAQAASIPPGTQLAQDQSITINNGTEVASLDPHKTEGVPESDVITNLLEGLITTDSAGQLVPGVAQSWDRQQNVWTFTLRPEARWSNGEPVTAQDFVYSWQRLADPKTASPYASYLQYAHIANVDEVIAGRLPPAALGVKALDARRFQVTLSQPVPWFTAMLAHTALKPVYRPTIEQWGDKWTRPEHYVGNGAFTLNNWVVNEKITLKRNPQYWDNAHTVIETVTFLPISSETSDINRYRSGGVDITNSAIPPELFPMLKKDLGSQVRVSPYLCTFYYELNNQRAPFNDARVRAAVKLTLDRQIIAEKVMGQGQIPAFSLTPPYIDGVHFSAPAWFRLTQAERNAQAKQLLAQASYGEQKPLSFTLLYNTSDQNKKQAIAAASMWKKNLGANVTLQNQEWKTMLNTRHEGNYDVARATWCADYNEPSTFLNMMLSDASTNTGFYRSPAFDALIAQSLNAADAKQRAALYQQAEAQLDKDSALVPVYYRVSVRLVKPWVGGYTGHDPQDRQDIKHYYIIKH